MIGQRELTGSASWRIFLAVDRDGQLDATQPEVVRDDELQRAHLDFAVRPN
jgi:hypothetical protein